MANKVSAWHQSWLLLLTSKQGTPINIWGSLIFAYFFVPYRNSKTDIMDNIIDEKFYTYYMVNGGLVQIRTNIEMNINSRIQKRTSKVQHKNIVSEHDCINDNWQDLVTEINNKLKKEDLELIHFNVDK
jgi:hypothetical protein